MVRPEILVRAATPADVAEMCALVNRGEEHDSSPARTGLDELAELFAGPGFDPAHDSRLVVSGDRLVAAGWVRFSAAGEQQERAYLEGVVHPEWRALGIGRDLLRWQVDRARAILEALDTELPRYIRVSNYEFMHDARRLVRRAGFREVRWFHDMLRPLDEALPDRRAVGGVELIPWPIDRDEELREIKNAAFAQHWGSAPMSASSWRSWMGAGSTRLDLSVAAIDRETGRLIGHCVAAHYPGDRAATGRHEAWIDNVGTVPAARGRGVASWMIAECLHRFAAAGFSHAVLEVDTDNHTGAMSVYQRLGFAPVASAVAAELAI